MLYLLLQLVIFAVLRLVPISHNVGDLVYSCDTITGEVSQKAVTDTFIRTSDHLNHLTIIDGSSNEQVIETTDGHPFWVVTDEPDLTRAAGEVAVENGVVLYHENIGVTENGYWVEAKDLRVGDVFLGASGELSTLVNKERVEFSEGITVYNFTFDGNHDYFVITQTGEFGQTCVLVHNADYDIQNGVHRTAAARDLGKEDIRANINSSDGHIISEDTRVAIKDLHSPRSALVMDKYLNALNDASKTPNKVQPIEVMLVTRSRRPSILDIHEFE